MYIKDLQLGILWQVQDTKWLVNMVKLGAALWTPLLQIKGVDNYLPKLVFKSRFSYTAYVRLNILKEFIRPILSLQTKLSWP